MTIIDRAGRAFAAHRNALLEIDRGGHSADAQFLLDALTEINHWGDRDQRAALTSEILDALEAGELDDTALRSLASTEEYLNPGGWESGTCEDGEYITSAGNYAPITDGDDGSGTILFTCPRQVVVWEVRDSVPTLKRCGRPVADDSPSFYCARHANS